MPTPLGAHSPLVDAAAALHKKRERRERNAFLFEGATLLAEALASQISIERIFVTDGALAKNSEIVRDAETRGAPVHIVPERALKRLSDLETPSGLVVEARTRLAEPDEILAGQGLVLLLAGVSDPGNAGTLLRAGEAFGAAGVLFGAGSVEPYHPKVVRAAMGALFRLRAAEAPPEALAGRPAAWEVVGLRAGAPSLAGLKPAARRVVVVGHERAGLGEYEALCTAFAGIPMSGPTESLNAAVAGAIALYELTKRGAS